MPTPRVIFREQNRPNKDKQVSAAFRERNGLLGSPLQRPSYLQDNRQNYTSSANQVTSMPNKVMSPVVQACALAPQNVSSDQPIQLMEISELQSAVEKKLKDAVRGKLEAPADFDGAASAYVASLFGCEAEVLKFIELFASAALPEGKSKHNSESISGIVQSAKQQVQAEQQDKAAYDTAKANFEKLTPTVEDIEYMFEKRHATVSYQRAIESNRYKEFDNWSATYSLGGEIHVHMLVGEGDKLKDIIVHWKPSKDSEERVVLTWLSGAGKAALDSRK